jgi:hypothetical protein
MAACSLGKLAVSNLVVSMKSSWRGCANLNFSKIIEGVLRDWKKHDDEPYRQAT